MHCSLCFFPIPYKVFFYLGDKKGVTGRVRHLVITYSYDCMGVISYSSKKSLISPLYKFTTQNFDFTWETKLAYHQYVLNDLSIFWEDGKKIVPLESRAAFCRLFTVQIEKVCYERKVQAELLGWFSHCASEVTLPMFLLQALGWCCYGTG